MGLIIKHLFIWVIIVMIVGAILAMTVESQATAMMIAIFGAIFVGLFTAYSLYVFKIDEVNAKDKYGKYLFIKLIISFFFASIMAVLGTIIFILWTPFAFLLALCSAAISGTNKVNAKDGLGFTSLHYVEDSEEARKLIDAGANPNVKNNDGYTPLHLVSSAEIAKMLVEAGAKLNAKADNGDTPLHMAVHMTESAKIAILSEAGADLNARTYITSSTPLHLAVWDNKPEIIKVLIDAQAQVNAKDKHGKTPLHLAVQDDKPEIVKMLIDAGAEVNEQDNDGRTPLFDVVWGDKRELARILMDAGAYIDGDNDGWTVLHEAASLDKADLAEMFIAYAEILVNMETEDGDTPLDVALAHKSEAVETVLRSAGGTCKEDYQTYIENRQISQD